MRAFVAGGAGFLGSHLVERLLAEGHEVDVVDDLSEGTLANLAAARADGEHRLKFHHLDVRLPELAAVVARHPPDVVFHLAAPAAAVTAADPVLDASVVIGGTLNVLEAARRAGAAKVVVAASAVDLYGPVAVRDLPVKESHPFANRTPAGITRRAVVEYLHAYREREQLEFSALAFTTLYGPRRRTGVVARFAGAGSGPITIQGDGRQTRDLLYVDDAVDALVRAAGKGGGLVVNVGTGTQTSIAHLAAMVADPDGPAPERAPARAGELGRFAVNPVRARIQLGWAPFTPLADGLAATQAWLASRTSF